MKELPKKGDRINHDPNRNDPDCPYRWTNVNRTSARVVDVILDGEYVLIVYAVWSKQNHCWRHHVMNQIDWEILPWDAGPLAKPPKAQQ